MGFLGRKTEDQGEGNQVCSLSEEGECKMTSMPSPVLLVPSIAFVYVFVRGLLVTLIDLCDFAIRKLEDTEGE